MARVSHFQELERQYIPGAAARIESSDGFGESGEAHSVVTLPTEGS